MSKADSATFKFIFGTYVVDKNYVFKDGKIDPINKNPDVVRGQIEK